MSKSKKLPTRVPEACENCGNDYRVSADNTTPNAIMLSCVGCGWQRLIEGPTKKERAAAVKAALFNDLQKPAPENLQAEIVTIKGRKFLLIDNMIALPVWKLREQHMQSFNAFKKGE